MKDIRLVPPRCLCPWPEDYCWKEGLLEFGDTVECWINAAPKAERVTTSMSDLWAKFTYGFGSCTMKAIDSLKPYQLLLVPRGVTPDPGCLPGLAPGMEYAISVTPSGVGISGAHLTGLQHAWITLVQMIAPHSLAPEEVKFAIPCCEIQDRPSLEFRGIHVCIFPETTLNFLEKIVRLSAMLKYSHIVLEFWGTLRLDAMPELAWPHAYTKDDIRPIIDAAHSMGLQVVPMFNHLGHASGSRHCHGKHVVLDQNPRRALLFEPDGWTWCLSNPDVHKLLAAVRAELIELCGEGDYIHLGCDEAYSFMTCDRCYGKDGARMYADYVNGITDELSHIGRRPIIWGDCLLDGDLFKDTAYRTHIPDISPQEIVRHLDRRVIVADWQYDIKSGRVPTAEYLIREGFDTLLSPWKQSENAKALSQNARELNALGVLLTTWNDLSKPAYLFYASRHAWSSDEGPGGKHRDAILMGGKMAEWIRKLVPANGDYYAAGSTRHDVDA